MTAATGTPRVQPEQRGTTFSFDPARLPVTVHYLSMLLGAVTLLWMGRNQNFFFDDWAFLDTDDEGAINLPHGGHWSAAPTLAFLLMRRIFGVDHHLPFLALAVLMHLLIVHLLWRIMGRIGVLPWVRTLFALVLMFLGAGAENILWAFQFGFMGAVALALAAGLLLDRPALSPRGGLAAAVLAVVSLTFSGTALPVLVAVGIISLARRGFRRSVIVLGPAVLVYACWYVVFAKTEPVRMSYGPTGAPADVVGQTIVFAAHMFVDGLGKVLPLPGFGVVIVAVLILWLLRGLPRASDTSVPAFALLLGAVVFAVLTGFSRAGLGIDSASSSRYVYLVTALVLPALALFTSQLIVRTRLRLVPVLVALGAVTCAGLVALQVDSVRQAALEEDSRGRLAAALADALAQPENQAMLDLAPVPRWAPDLEVREILTLHERGYLAQGPYDLQDELDVGPYFFATMAPSAPPAACTATPVAALGVPAHSSRLIGSDAEADGNFSLHAGDLSGFPEQVTFPSGWTVVTNTSDFELVIGAGTGVLVTICT